jgi:hypothetical protein
VLLSVLCIPVPIIGAQQKKKKKQVPTIGDWRKREEKDVDKKVSY